MVVDTAQDRSSIFPDGRDWTTLSPCFTVQIGIQLARPLFIARMSVYGAKQAVPVLLCPLVLACLLFILFIEALWVFVRDGSRSVLTIPALSVMVVAGCFPISSVLIGTISAPSLWEEGVVRVVVECARHFADESFFFRLCVSKDTVLVNSKKPVMVELLSEISPSGA